MLGAVTAGALISINRASRSLATFQEKEAIEDMRNRIRMGLDCQKTATVVGATCPGTPIQLRTPGDGVLIQIPAGSVYTQEGSTKLQAFCTGSTEKSVNVQYLTAEPGATWKNLFDGVPIVCKNSIFPLPTCTLTATPNPVATGLPTVIGIMAQNASSATIAGQNATVPNGAVTVTPGALGMNTIVATVNGPGGTNTCQIGVNVLAPSCTLDAVPDTVVVNTPTTVTITVQNATSATIGGAAVTVPTGSRTFTYATAGPRTIVGTVAGPFGAATCQVTVTVDPPACTGIQNIGNGSPFAIRNFVNTTVGWNAIPPSNSAPRYHSPTATRICQLTGYRTRLISFNDVAPPYQSRTGWHSPGDERLSYWNGAGWTTQSATSLGNRWMSNVRCGCP